MEKISHLGRYIFEIYLFGKYLEKDISFLDYIFNISQNVRILGDFWIYISENAGKIYLSAKKIYLGDIFQNSGEDISLKRYIFVGKRYKFGDISRFEDISSPEF